MQTHTLREQWNTAHHQEAVVYPDVHHVEGQGTFEYPDTLYSIAGKTAFEGYKESLQTLDKLTEPMILLLSRLKLVQIGIY